MQTNVNKLIDNTVDAYTAVADLLREDFQEGFKKVGFDTAFVWVKIRELI